MNNPKVRVELSENNEDDASVVEHRLRALEQQSSACVSYLLLRGFKKADALLIKAKKKVKDAPVTKPHSLERQVSLRCIGALISICLIRLLTFCFSLHF